MLPWCPAGSLATWSPADKNVKDDGQGHALGVEPGRRITVLALLFAGLVQAIPQGDREAELAPNLREGFSVILAPRGRFWLPFCRPFAFAGVLKSTSGT